MNLTLFVAENIIGEAKKASGIATGLLYGDSLLISA